MREEGLRFFPNTTVVFMSSESWGRGNKYIPGDWLPAFHAGVVFVWGNANEWPK